jgi:hypothetical protein
MVPFARPAGLVLLACLALPTAAAAQFRDPVFDDPLPPPPKPYQPPVQPAPFVPPPPAPAFHPDFPPPRVMAAPVGPARPITGTVCLVPAAKSQPAARCETERAVVGTACDCAAAGTKRVGRVRVR